MKQNHSTNGTCLRTWIIIKVLSTTIIGPSIYVRRHVCLVERKNTFSPKNTTSNVDMENLKETEINVNHLTLLEAYYLILPMNSNVVMLFNFRNMILFHLDRQLNVYIYRHAMTIILYMKYIVEKHAWSGLSESLSWYTNLNEPFYKYLSIPIDHQPR